MSSSNIPLTEDPARPGMVDPATLEAVFQRYDNWFSYAKANWPNIKFAATQQIVPQWWALPGSMNQYQMKTPIWQWLILQRDG